MTGSAQRSQRVLALRRDKTAAELVVPMMEEPPATKPTSPDDGAHDEGDPTDAWDGEEA